jgi:initiation factor 1A
MVKNVTGGSKSKGFARKNFVKKDHALRVSQEEDEIYAQVTKVYGGPMCQVITIDGAEMLCHIRGKFRGRGKRDNFIGNGTWLLVGKREWEKEAAKGKLLNCDVIEVYNDADKVKLKNNVTSVNWNLFITYDSKTIGSSDNDGALNDVIEFADEKTQEYQDLINAQVDAAQSGKSNIVISTDDGEIIDVDDI